MKCQGCCRYKQDYSAWRPKLGAEDKKELGLLITSRDVLDGYGYIKTIQNCGEHFCKFLNAKTNECGIYSKRPFECSFYPFVLSQTPEGVKVYVHLSCPYVQDHLPRAVFDSHVAYLKEFFRSPEIREFLSSNKQMFHDYTSYAPELLHLFDLTFL